MQIVSIHIYPIKGLKGIQIRESWVFQKGLEYDRRWMLIDENNNFLSQRTQREMALFTTAINGSEIKVSYKNEGCSFNIEEEFGELLSGKVWDSTATFREVNAAASKWFSDQLGHKARLVKQCDAKPRVKVYSNKVGETEVSLADGYPMLLLGTASMDLLNSKLEESVDIDRFRANLIVDTEIPHVEDNWKEISIGSSQIEIIKPCARCQVVNINQSTSDSSKHVLKALSTYRKVDNKIYFGANASCLEEGLIKVGDLISLVE